MNLPVTGGLWWGGLTKCPVEIEEGGGVWGVESRPERDTK